MNSPHERVLVFEEGGFTYVWDDLVDAQDCVESVDVKDGYYVGAFRADGRVVRIVPTADAYAELELTAEYDLPALTALVRTCRYPGYLAGESVAEFAERYLEDRRGPRDPKLLGKLWARVRGNGSSSLS